MTNSTPSLIALAVEPLRAAAMDRAEKKAKEILMDISEKLAANNFDRSLFAPYPSSKLYGNAYHEAKGYYDLVRSCTKTTWSSKRPSEPDTAKMDFDVSSKFIQRARENASSQYDAYIEKLDSKIDKVTEATLAGDHVWSYSILKVVKEDGTTENWKTQMIVNVSKLGKLFNQFPTRKVK